MNTTVGTLGKLESLQKLYRSSMTTPVEHYPGLPNFPHHVHVGREESVEPGKRLSITQLLDVLDGEIPKGERE